MTRYTPAEIEARWQDAWSRQDIFKAVRSQDKPKYYVLEMFPYPSGRIHIGHQRAHFALHPAVSRKPQIDHGHVCRGEGEQGLHLPQIGSYRAEIGYQCD